MNNFILELTSVPDREKLVVEIWLDNNLLAEVSNETGEFEIEIYCEKDKIKLQLDELIEIIQKAKQKLKDN